MKCKKNKIQIILSVTTTSCEKPESKKNYTVVLNKEECKKRVTEIINNKNFFLKLKRKE
ncbi:hypothetical protein AB8B23_01275 [Leptotrichia sp. HSP-342]|uniref:Lipoprotein n=1 Tax=Leptotrichia mesophila TaxID=3239303 RepID=A0AB39VCR6_9FUSO